MSGHSKWSQIKRQKAKTDVKKGLTFTKLANAITIAVKQGGGITDPNQNFRLRLVIDSARALNMPKENIERAIQRAAKKDGMNIEEVVYEGFSPGGVSVIIEAATDNSQRTTSEIKNIFNKAGGSFGQPGSVLYQFTQIGQITVAKNGNTFDEIFSVAADNGAGDIEEEGENVFILTKGAELSKMRDKFIQNGYKILDAVLTRKPLTTIEISDPQRLKTIESFLEAISNLDDVQNVYSNIA